MEQSGHLSNEGVRSHEKMSESQKKKGSDILSDITHSSTVNSATVTAVTPVSRQIPWDADSLGDGLDDLFKDVPDVRTTVQHPSHALKGFQFQNMQGCTFNFRTYLASGGRLLYAPSIERVVC